MGTRFLVQDWISKIDSFKTLSEIKPPIIFRYDTTSSFNFHSLVFEGFVSKRANYTGKSSQPAIICSKLTTETL